MSIAFPRDFRNEIQLRCATCNVTDTFVSVALQEIFAVIKLHPCIASHFRSWINTYRGAKIHMKTFHEVKLWHIYPGKSRKLKYKTSRLIHQLWHFDANRKDEEKINSLQLDAVRYSRETIKRLSRLVSFLSLAADAIELPILCKRERKERWLFRREVYDGVK